MARRLLYLRDVRNPFFLASLGGLVATAIDVSVLVALVEHGVPVVIAAFFAAGAGAAAGFVTSKYVAFRDRTPLSARQLAAFGLVAVGTACWMALGMAIFAVALHVPYLLAKAICAAIVFAGWSYPVQRKLVFRAVAA
jgi:putative flippase GtrA